MQLGHFVLLHSNLLLLDNCASDDFLDFRVFDKADVFSKYISDGIFVLRLGDSHSVAPELKLLGLFDLFELVHSSNGLDIHVTVVTDWLFFSLFELQGLVIKKFFAFLEYRESFCKLWST